MRVAMECPRCREIDERRRSVHEVSSGKRSLELRPVYLHEMGAADLDSGKLTFRCEKGHTTVVTMPIPAFELLFDFGCSALLYGYSREAVTSFASSFERFQEFTCRFLLARRNVSLEGVEAWWKEVARQTERQIGSFVAVWIADFHGPPPLLPQKLVEFRNDCVHKGRIPPESEAKAYGEAVLRAEVGGIVRLRNCFESELEYDDFVEHHIIRPGASEPHDFSYIRNTVLSGMWRPNEYQPDEDEAESGEGPVGDKNTTDPTRLTIDQALRTFAVLRSLGVRRK